LSPKRVWSLLEKPDTPGEPVRSLVAKPDTPEEGVRYLLEGPFRPRRGMRSLTTMARSNGEDMGALLVRSMLALPMLGVELAELLGISDRTLRRWVNGGVRLDRSRLVT